MMEECTCRFEAGLCDKDKEANELRTRVEALSKDICALKAKLDESARCNGSQKKELEALQEQLEVKDSMAEELCHEG